MTGRPRRPEERDLPTPPLRNDPYGRTERCGCLPESGTTTVESRQPDPQRDPGPLTPPVTPETPNTFPIRVVSSVSPVCVCVLSPVSTFRCDLTP